MASSSRDRQAKQNANVAISATSRTTPTTAGAASLATDALTGLQATLEKTMQEMAQVSSILKELQEDVSSVKTAQAKTTKDINNINERLDEADGRFMDLETENARLASELQKRAKQCEELERAIQESENRERRLNLRLVGLKESQGENLKVQSRQCIEDVLEVVLADNEIQRAYRPGPPPAEAQTSPRPIVKIPFTAGEGSGDGCCKDKVQAEDSARMEGLKDLILSRRDKSCDREEEEIYRRSKETSCYGHSIYARVSGEALLHVEREEDDF